MTTQQQKQKRDSRRALPSASQGGRSAPPELAALQAQRLERRKTNQRIADLKLQLLHLTEHHMDHVVRLIRRWLAQREQ
ncbi:MAG: flagellar M-ring protein FliF [Desulfovibrio sp.]|nr:flagellar M-ring protein FliF [Desulfovibrio sp.]